MASHSVNKVILIGDLGRDAETKFTPSGVAATRFSVATSRRWKDKESEDWKEETNWTNVVVWRQEKLAEYLVKGKQVYVEGRLQTRSYDDEDGKKVYATEVIAEDVILLGSQGESHNIGSGGTGQQTSRAPAAGSGVRTKGSASVATADGDDFPEMHITDADIPF
jgi:single-strand DNA-binding protein